MSVKKRPYLTVGVTIVAVIILGILGLIGFMLIDGDNVKSNDDKEQSKTQAALALADHSTTQPPEPTTLPTSDPLQVAQTPVSENTSWEVAVQEFDGAKMVLVPVGCLMMGSENGDDDEKPVHHVCFEAPFWIDMTEVTNAQFAAFDGQAANESYFPGEERPREQITWAEAAAYCEHRGGRLPTEAEWEYAARGPDNWLYPWGDRWDPYKVVWSGNSDSQTVDVGSKPEGASWVGALDMSGNVGEWVTDWYDPDYYGLLADNAINPTGPELGANRVVRGGSWFGAGEDDFRASFRFDANPRGWDYYIGFRCARSG